MFQEEEAAVIEREQQLRLDEELARELEAEDAVSPFRRAWQDLQSQVERDEEVARGVNVTYDDSVAEVDLDESVLQALDDSFNHTLDISDYVGDEDDA